jgi:hypothetical protein|nr:hypothetical protein [uncultured Rhodopila sp.]
MDTGNITATFGPVQGDRAALTRSARTTLDAIYQHPLSHNLEWADVVALFSRLGTVDHMANNEYVFAIGGEHRQMWKPHGKNILADNVIEFRHMLTRAGWSPAAANVHPAIVA